MPDLMMKLAEIIIQIAAIAVRNFATKQLETLNIMILINLKLKSTAANAWFNVNDHHLRHSGQNASSPSIGVALCDYHNSSDEGREEEVRMHMPDMKR